MVITRFEMITETMTLSNNSFHTQTHSHTNHHINMTYIHVPYASITPHDQMSSLSLYVTYMPNHSLPQKNNNLIILSHDMKPVQTFNVFH